MSKRPSPDTVICIDLTEDDDERDENLNDVRKRLKGTPDSNAPSNIKSEGASARALNNNTDNDEVEIIEPGAPEIHAATAQAASTNDDDIELVGTANETRLPHMRQHCPDNKFVQDVVALNRQRTNLAVGKGRQVDEGKTGNASFCDLCYCFVCDKPAKECASWEGHGLTYSSHCHASDAGYDARIWKTRRANAKAGISNASSPAALPGMLGSIMLPPSFQSGHQNQSGPVGDGPFEPGNAQAAQCLTLTKCRKCGWFNRFSHKNFSWHPTYGWNHKHSPLGSDDWCHACGRIASVKDFSKLQASPYSRTPNDVFLGERVIPFRIVAHDPRQMEKFQERWTSHQGDPKWDYSEIDEEEDLFKHRFGTYPRVEVILGSIPVFDADNIPKDTSKAARGTFKVHYNTDFIKYGSNDPGYDPDDYDEDGYREEPLNQEFNADETEGIIVENTNDLTLLRELHALGTIACVKRKPNEHNLITTYVGGDIVAKWDRQARSGTFVVRLFLQSRLFHSSDPSHCASLSRLFGSWFNVFPFTLSDLSSLVPAKECEMAEARGDWERGVGRARREAALANVSAEMKNLVKTHNECVDAKLQQTTLNSSTNSNVIGGVCPVTATGLEGVLKRYFSETFFEDVIASNGGWRRETVDAWVDRGQGLVSRHRYVRDPRSHVDPRKSQYGHIKDTSNIGACLSAVDQALAISNLEAGCFEVKDKTGTLKGMLEHLENVHHPPVPFVEGLNIELLEYQRQSVQWALEREKTPGGVQSFLWAKLPEVAEPDQEVYYSPILERVRRDKPLLVRGGIIAEEMGLGKTVISLALILKNPAPAVPQSGNAITVLNEAALVPPPVNETWDKDLYARTSTTNSKRGSIISRGTLVVCPVSLVGQWIDEAKSKLKDPGLVYPYHGQGRKRNAAMLAQNAIVVTTYETLASDATYHAKKGGADYCAPCEQVRWWRIICDESHSLRESNTKKSMAVMNLVADHKWLVSGTPVNTSFKDLKNQLKFIGLENVDEMFNGFGDTAMKHVNDPNRPKSRGRPFCRDDRVFGHFVFMLRSIIVRHTHKQTYRGTTTTLMSLPPKTERTVEVNFSEEEKEDYNALDKSARDFYTNFKEEQGHKLSSHYLLLTQKLVPLRIAASGGHVPLEVEEEKKRAAKDEDTENQEDDIDDDDDSEDQDDSEEEDEEVAPKKKRAKKEKRFSEFAYSSKLNALVEELNRARDEDKHAKSLVFSQFASTITWLQNELPKHGFQYRTLSGDMSMKKRAKALHDFQHDPPTTIFLLSMRSGAVGINLTQANRVFLMEPCFNPALEAQAIGRVHRLGQKRNVEIVRFIMKDSIEPRILQMLKNKYADKSPDEVPAEIVEEVVDRRGRKTKRLAEVLVGSLHSDRTVVLTEEFDLLFGVAEPPVPTAVIGEKEVEQDSGMEAEETVTSASI